MQMMYSKLSLRNVKRSFKDYAIYFLTITFAVSLFYSFNSLTAQQAMLKLSNSQEDMVQDLIYTIGIISIFISTVLAFLIIFANSFLVKRRKKELGMYMTLGMSKFNISKILVMETFFIGLVSLLVGLGLGTILSQGLSLLTAALFQVDIQEYTFVFSTTAMLKTILYFGIIFLIVMLFNVIMINRYKLIDLFIANKKNQQVKLKRTSTAIGVFVLSLLLIGSAYFLMLKYGLFKSMNLLWTSVGLGSIGTFLFFFSLSGFLLNIAKKNEKLYYKNINIFLLRQINSKVNSTFISMTIICLMLFFTIGVLSTGFSLKNSLEKDLTVTTPYDSTLSFFKYEESDENLEKKLEELNVKQYGDNITFKEYYSDESISSYLKGYTDKQAESVLEGNASTPLTLIKRSSYEGLARLQGKDPVNLQQNEVLILTNQKDMKKTMKRFVDNNKSIKINHKEYPLSGFQFMSVRTDTSARDTMIVVLPDQAVSEMEPSRISLNIQYEGEANKADQELYNLIETYNKNADKNTYLLGMTKTLAYEDATGTSTMIVYIGIYLGIIFLISSAAILALQQLSEASDNKARYDLLKKIGVTQKEVNQSIFKQIFIYFMMPLSLAIIHSIFGIKVVNRAIVSAGESNVFFPSLLTAGVIIVVYGGYFLATYSGYKSILKK